LLLASLLINQKEEDHPSRYSKLQFAMLKIIEFENFKPEEAADFVSEAKFYNCKGSKTPSLI
jgi:hypothetical protein